MGKFTDLLGTINSFLKIGITGVMLKNSPAGLLIRNNADSADANITANLVNVSGNSLILNSDATNSGSDRSVVIARPVNGMSASYTLTVPPSAGSPGQVLQTDGSGNTTWVSVAGTSDKITVDTTTLSFGSTSPTPLFTLPENAVVRAARVLVDTAFTGTPSLSVGVTGATSKYIASNQIDLTTVGQYEIYPNTTPNTSAENLIATYSPGSATAGLARIEIDYAVPS